MPEERRRVLLLHRPVADNRVQRGLHLPHPRSVAAWQLWVPIHCCGVLLLGRLGIQWPGPQTSAVTRLVETDVMPVSSFFCRGEDKLKKVMRAHMFEVGRKVCSFSESMLYSRLRDLDVK